jgi:hypothetical protein
VKTRPDLLVSVASAKAEPSIHSISSLCRARRLASVSRRALSPVPRYFLLHSYLVAGIHAHDGSLPNTSLSVTSSPGIASSRSRPPVFLFMRPPVWALSSRSAGRTPIALDLPISVTLCPIRSKARRQADRRMALKRIDLNCFCLSHQHVTRPSFPAVPHKRSLRADRRGYQTPIPATSCCSPLWPARETGRLL